MQFLGLPERGGFLRLRNHLGCVLECFGRPNGQGTISPSATSRKSYLTSCGFYQASQVSYLTSWVSYLTVQGIFLVGSYLTLRGSQSLASPQLDCISLGSLRGGLFASSGPSWVRLGLLWAPQGPGHHFSTPNFVGILSNFVWVQSNFARVLFTFVGVLLISAGMLFNFAGVVLTFARVPVSWAF